MKRTLTTLFAACTLMGVFPVAAHAGPATDALTQCLVSSVTDTDKTALVRWTFTLMAHHPEVKPLANISPEQQVEADKGMAAIMTRLFTEDCPQQIKAAIAEDGQASLFTAFKVVGEVAMMGLMSHPDVTAGGTSFTQYLDLAKIGAAIN